MEVADGLGFCCGCQYLNGIQLIQATYSRHLPIIFNALIENEAVLTRLMLHYKNVSIHAKSKPLFWTE